MSEINFMEPTGKKPETRDFGTLLLIVIIILAAVVVAFLTLRKTTEFSILEKEKTTMANFTNDPNTLQQLKEYDELKDSIARVKSVNMPIAKAYVDYKILNTVTSPLIENYIWAPINANPDTMEFKAFSAAGNNLTVNVCVEDTGVMRQYQSALIDMTVTVDKDSIDKLPGAQTANNDMVINKFRNQFTTQITLQRDPAFMQPYEGILSIFINKDITEDMYKLLGKEQ